MAAEGGVPILNDLEIGGRSAGRAANGAGVGVKVGNQRVLAEAALVGSLVADGGGGRSAAILSCLEECARLSAGGKSAVAIDEEGLCRCEVEQAGHKDEQRGGPHGGQSGCNTATRRQCWRTARTKRTSKHRAV